jgi:hypothetical protein
VLRFFAYLTEAASEMEGRRVRRCVLLYHLEDSTLAINMQRTADGRLPHGPLLKRHK